MEIPDLSVARRVMSLLDASPTPFHAVQTASQELTAAGFVELEADQAPIAPGRQYVRQGGALVAWVVGERHNAATGVRVVAAHSDSPNLRIKPQPDTAAGSWRQLGVEVYGSALLNSWLDRDLGLAGRVVIRDGDRTATRLVRDNRPLLRIPQLAIHLDSEIRNSGLVLNPQRHLVPIWGLDPEAGEFRGYLAELLSVDADDVLSWDMMAHALTPAALTGLDQCFLTSSRIDNLLSCFLGLDALLALATDPGPRIPVLCLFDHEEVGSVSSTGAASPMLSGVLKRLNAALGGDLEDLHRSRLDSLVLSADGSHATHPNYPDRHEPNHQIGLNRGPVLKFNANQRYATDAQGAAAFTLACERAGAPMQKFVNRSDLACGSTIGPLTAAELQVAVIDAGCAQLAMHSASETAGSHDPGYFLAALTELLAG
ncbi:MAG: M18 family aminopeptidase [Acidimicrobiaceae bacterium]|nr:M18 family aminopeptidase [Acidimicrobiaceae bacterium]MDE0607614.1 M18 family aminopeptidase [Acidimicrobiaceae bacterium]